VTSRPITPKASAPGTPATEPLPVPQRTPDHESEARLLEIRRAAEKLGRLEGTGIRPAGAPFPQASPATGYYGIHMLKEPQWNWAIPLYFFVGGAAGSAGMIGTMADWVGDNYELARKARLLALGGGALSGALLVYDLGRPSRFLNMLRVFKPQSPMSMGAWCLSAFSSASAAAAFADVVAARWNGLPVRVLGGMGKLGSALFGMPFSNYTGVLIGATAMPVWNHSIDTLPIHFGMSGLQSSVSLLELWGFERSTALNLLGMGAAAFETWEGFHIESDPHRSLKPLKTGVSGWITRAGGALSGPVALGLRLTAAITGDRNMRRAAAYTGIAGSLLTRYGWMRAGHASAQDWRLPLDIAEDSAVVPELQSKPKKSQAKAIAD
jgi:Polysulphide reductase, NrfD